MIKGINTKAQGSSVCSGAAPVAGKPLTQPLSTGHPALSPLGPLPPPVGIVGIVGFVDWADTGLQVPPMMARIRTIHVIVIAIANFEWFIFILPGSYESVIVIFSTNQ